MDASGIEILQEEVPYVKMDDDMGVNVARGKARLNTMKCEHEEAKSSMKEVVDVCDVSMHVNGE